MKAIIEYDISGDDKEDYELMNQSRDIHLAVWKFLNEDDLEEILNKKYSNKDIEIYDLMYIIRNHLYDIMHSLNVNIDILS